ncbi:glycosyl transferase, group 1 family [Roseibium sp. TrichSKD4]|uniref:glycosyltransferase n=1 Tax=Roseibium sp. TrichSKD4 TaxID=744980 RepID=UPI0001E56417|nr:glycosyltransferase [Roseibium sp. TrichSKD4]EFO33531.1 glycosyl transferase, group 1 family [Roseibium sp. TrichSKD4]
MKSRLLFVIGSLDYGGAERHLVRILPGLAKTWDITVFTLSHPGAQADELRAKGVKVRSSWLGPKKNTGRFYRSIRQLGAVSALVCHLLVERPKIVHYFLPQAYMIGAPCALLLGIRTHVMSRRSRNFYQSKYLYVAKIERVLHRFMTAVLGNSLEVIKDLRSEGVAESKLGLIYNALAPGELAIAPDKNSRRDLLELPNDALVLVKVANLIPYKGHRDLIDALALVDRNIPWHLLCIGGDSGILGELQAHAEKLGISDRIVWLGRRADVERFLKIADIGVLASHEEGFSNSILEYMAAQLPVIVTRVGGAAEAIKDGETGILVPPHNPPALAEAIVRLADPEIRRSMGKAGREQLISKFSYDKCIENYETLYRSLMSGQGIPPTLKHV